MTWPHMLARAMLRSRSTVASSYLPVTPITEPRATGLMGVDFASVLTKNRD